MKLHRVRITNFKSVLDSGWFTVDELTALVGKNESGKTAILEAIEKLNSVDQSRGQFLKTDYPRMRLSESEDSFQADVAIESQWLLDDDEEAHINELAGPEVLQGRTVTLKKGYANKLEWDIPFDYGKAVSQLLENSGLSASDMSKLKDAVNVSGLIERLKKLEAPSARLSAFLDELNNRYPAGGILAQTTRYLADRLPKFVYYSNYDRLPGRVSIDQIIAAKAQNSLDQIEGSKVFTSLLSMVGTSPEDLKTITTSEDLISKLEAVQSRISRKIFTYWSQNRHLKVRFYFGEASPGDPPPFNTGKVFQTRIENIRHEATINLSERSTGFIWFFSFLVWFSEVRREHGENLIVLLDEPGLSLHGRAQFDLLRFIKEELLTQYQVIYSTHSPFMIDPSNLLSCRTVEDVVTNNDEVLGTKVGDDVLSTDRDTLFPLQAALGYDITQTLFVGEHTLLVEGPSDLLYIYWASAELTALGREGLDRRWTVTPCEGLAKVSSFLALFGGNRLHVAVLTDYGQGDKSKVRELRESALLREGHVFTADMFVPGTVEADVEDMLGREFYVPLVNTAYSLKSSNKVPKTKPGAAPTRVTLEVKQHFQTLPPSIPEYDHFKPARYLITHPNDPQLGTGKDQALDRFETLFKELNKLL